MLTLTEPQAPIRPSELHRRRVRVMLWIGSTIMVVMGLGWGLYFAATGAWTIVPMDAVILGAGLTSGWLTYRKRTRRAFWVLVVSMFLIICGVSLFLDVPSLQAPRSTHHFLLVLAVASLLFLRDERASVRYGVTGACLAAFVMLASSQLGATTHYGLPDSMRVWGTWVNNIFSALGVYLLIHVMVSDIAEHSSLEIDLRKGLLREEFFLVYQPQLTAQGQVTGAEALLRWRHPKLGLVPPDEFIPLAEQSGLILPLGAGCGLLAGRLWHRLLVAELPQAPAAGSAQDRSVFCARRADRP